MTDTLTAQELRFERELAAPVETVWEYLVDPELRARWFMGGPTDAREGGKLGLTVRHDRLADAPDPAPEKYAAFQGRSWTETITRIDPPRLLAFTWNEVDGEVTIELTPAGEGRTRLTLSHVGITSADRARNFGGGWAAHLAVLEKRLAGEVIPSFWALFHQAEARANAAITAD